MNERKPRSDSKEERGEIQPHRGKPVQSMKDEEKKHKKSCRFHGGAYLAHIVVRQVPGNAGMLQPATCGRWNRIHRFRPAVMEHDEVPLFDVEQRPAYDPMPLPSRMADQHDTGARCPERHFLMFSLTTSRISATPSCTEKRMSYPAKGMPYTRSGSLW